MIHIYVYAGLTVVMLGILWAAFTLPVALMLTETVVLTGTAATVGKFMLVFVDCLPILAGLSLLAWGFIKSVEEREFGFTNI